MMVADVTQTQIQVTSTKAESTLDGKELKRLIRLCHPNEHGEPYYRSQVISMIRERGQQVLIDLGWPIDNDSKYYRLTNKEVETLYEVLHTYGNRPELAPTLSAMHDLEVKMNDLTNGDFYGGFGARGLETYGVAELRRVIKPHRSPELNEALYKCVLYHKAFYEQLHDCSLTDSYLKSDISAHNIIKLARWQNIPTYRLVRDDEIPPKDYTCASAVWMVVESYNPLPDDVIPVQCSECERWFTELNNGLCGWCMREFIEESVKKINFKNIKLKL